MAIPHDVQKRLIKKRLLGKEGKARVLEIKKILSEIPNYYPGPYGRIRKSLREEIKRTKMRSKVKHQDWLGVKRQGLRQFVLVGAPSVGKSSLIVNLSQIQVKIASYEFTTLKPIPAVIDLYGAPIQIVDLPGLLKGATEDIGKGKRLIGIVKNTDGILLMHDLSKPLDKLNEIVNELKKAQIKKPIIIIGNKSDLDLSSKNFKRLKQRFPNKMVIAISTLNNKGINLLKKEIWRTCKLIRVYTGNEKVPMILEEGANILDLTRKIHNTLVKEFKMAVINGPSAKFPNQQVGLTHILKDLDRVKIVIKH